jgi:hypothetical protein
MRVKKSENINVRLAPAQKQAATELADRSGLSLADIVRLSLSDALEKAKEGKFPEVLSKKLEGVEDG